MFGSFEFNAQDFFFPSNLEINVLLQIMLNRCLNTADVLQKKLPFTLLMPSVCSLCHADTMIDYVFFWVFLFFDLPV